MVSATGIGGVRRQTLTNGAYRYHPPLDPLKIEHAAESSNERDGDWIEAQPIDCEEDEAPKVAIFAHDEDCEVVYDSDPDVDWGYNRIELTPDEARTLADYLTRAAAACDDIAMCQRQDRAECG